MTVRRRRHGVVVAVLGCQGRPSTLPCCRRRCPTSGGCPRSKGGYTVSRRRGDRGIAAVMTAALVQWARIPTRGVRAGAALAASDREGGHQRRMPVHDGAMGNREGEEGATTTGTTATGGGGAGGGGGGARVRGRLPPILTLRTGSSRGGGRRTPHVFSWGSRQAGSRGGSPAGPASL